jgi:hypothetical protein
MSDAPENNPVDKLAQLKTLLDDPFIAKMAVTMLTSQKKGVAYSSSQLSGKSPTSKLSQPDHSNHPYYNADSAMRLKPTIDGMMATNKTAIMRYARFPNRKPNTLRQLFQQAWLYLCNNMDDEDGKYKKFREKISIEMTAVGIVFNYKPGFGPHLGLIPFTAELLDEPLRGDWMDQLKEFLQLSDKGKMFEQSGLEFTKLEIADINKMVDAANESGEKTFIIKRLDHDYLCVANITGVGESLSEGGELEDISLPISKLFTSEPME